MALALADRVNETTTTTGTGTVTLAGAVSGYQSFTVIGNGNTTYYTIVHQTLSEWEVGIGTYTASGTTLSRDTILASSNGGSAVNFSAGTKFVFCDYPAGRAVYLDSSTNVTVPQITLSSGTANGVLYLNGSKVATSGSTLVFDGSRLGVGVTPSEVIDANGAILSRSNLIAYTALVLQRSSSSLELPVAAYTNGSGNILSAGTKGDIVAFGNVGGDGVIFANSNTEQMRLTSTGLGIGTSSPAYKLDVAESGAPTSTNTFSVARISGSDSVANDLTLLGPNTSQVRIKFGDPESATIGEVGYNHSTNSLRFVTNGAEAGVFDSSGNLGLGVTPSAWNSVYRAFNIGSRGFVYGRTDNQETAIGVNWYRDAGASFVYAQNGYASLYLQTDGTHSWYNAANNTSGAGAALSLMQAMTLDASGRLGIGTTSPSQPLHVDASGGGVVRVTRLGTSATAYGQLENDGTNSSVTTTGALIFNTGSSPAERARIDTAGNLLLGTTTNIGTAPNIVVKQTSAGQQSFTAWNATTSGDPYFIEFGTEASYTARGSITYNRAAGLTSYNTTSDVRLKENIVDAEEAGSKIDAMQVRQFDWKETGSHLDYGFVAQELHAVAPHAVSKPEDDDKMWSVDYSKLVPMLVKEIQSLRARVAQLEAK